MLLIFLLTSLVVTLVAALDFSSDPSKYRFPMEQGGACYASADAYRECLRSRAAVYGGLTVVTALLVGLLLWRSHEKP